MSFFGSIQFFLLMILLFIPAAVLGLRGKSLRGYRTAASVLMIGLVMWPNKEQLLFLIAFYVLEFVLVKAYLKLRLAQGGQPERGGLPDLSFFEHFAPHSLQDFRGVG